MLKQQVLSLAEQPRTSFSAQAASEGAAVLAGTLAVQRELIERPVLIPAAKTLLPERPISKLAQLIEASPRENRPEQMIRLLGLMQGGKKLTMAQLCTALGICYSGKGAGKITGLNSQGQALLDYLSAAAGLEAKDFVGTAILGAPHSTCKLEISLDEVAALRKGQEEQLKGIAVSGQDATHMRLYREEDVESFLLKNRIGLVSRFGKHDEGWERPKQKLKNAKEQASKPKGPKPKQERVSPKGKVVLEIASSMGADSRVNLHSLADEIAQITGFSTTRVYLALVDGLKRSRKSEEKEQAGGELLEERHLNLTSCNVRKVWQELNLQTPREKLLYLQHLPADWEHQDLFEHDNAASLILDIPRAPMTSKNLSAHDEQDLFCRFNYLRYEAWKRVHELSADSVNEGDLSKVVGMLDRVRDIKGQVVEPNMGLVCSMVRRSRFAHYFDGNELETEANLALLRSVDTFDFSRGWKFSTYACGNINRALSRYAERVSRERAKLSGCQEQAEQVEAPQDEMRFEDDALHEAFREMHVQDALLTLLTEREREVVKLRLMPEGDEKRLTLEQVGLRIGRSKELVNQIEKKALAKLRLAFTEEDTDAADFILDKELRNR